MSRIRNFKPAAAGAAALLSLSVVGGCNTTASPTSGAVRTSAQTAPTDLQLLCASTAADQLKIPGGNVLPVSSMPAGDSAYQVNLTFDGGQAVCTIDSDGVISSITQV
ncbi:hypothetical protein FMN50_17100 [Rhodobacterales bacterium]|nr:hypothetical protein FMN50_17100 [Rhodobacterales bacterium]